MVKFLSLRKIIHISIGFRHSYIFVTCDFVAWTPKGIHIERIYPPDRTQVQVLCPEAVKAYNEHMGGVGVDLADQMYNRFYTCTHKSSHKWYV